MNKLPIITVDEWLQAEEEFRAKKLRPQPRESVTAVQYAEKNQISIKRAQDRLKEMHELGVCKREKWNNGLGVNAYVYFTKKK